MGLIFEQGLIEKRKGSGLYWELYRTQEKFCATIKNKIK